MEKWFKHGGILHSRIGERGSKTNSNNTKFKSITRRYGIRNVGIYGTRCRVWALMVDTNHHMHLFNEFL